MSIFETLGQAQLLREEGARQLSAALADGTRSLLRRLARVLASAFRHVPDEHPFP
jgi:hypothetical protein